ncbi:MAG TPA: MGMT family protein [Actinocrinis sp.]|nr:MGMT family protein [Actinocrinis sp.]
MPIGITLEGEGDLPPLARRVRELVRAIPPGKVLTYGDIAELLEQGGPRQIGAAMSRHGDGVPWWRVVNASGLLPPRLRGEAAKQYAEEGTPYDFSLERIRLRTARWDGISKAE